MAFRMLMLLIVLMVAGGFVLWERRSPSSDSADRTTRIGLALATVGATFSVFAWWMVFPLVVLLAGLVTIIAGRRRRTTLQ